MPSILLPASATVEGETSSRRPAPVATAAPASAALARNLRRFRYRLWGVISDEGMSADFLINIGTPNYIYAHPPRTDSTILFQSDRTREWGKSCNRSLNERRTKASLR